MTHRHGRLRNLQLPSKVIWFLTFQDTSTWGVFSAMNTFIGLYLANRLEGDIETYIGIGVGVYMFTRAVGQLILGYVADRMQGEQDEIITLTVATVLMALPFFLYPVITTPLQFVVLQFIFGLGGAADLVAWRKVFALHVDQRHAGVDYGVYGSFFSLSSAVFGVIAGLIANINDTWFGVVMAATGVVMLSGLIWIKLLANTISAGQLDQVLNQTPTGELPPPSESDRDLA